VIGDVAGKEAVAVLSQTRNLDSLRLYQKIDHIDAELLARTRKTASRMVFWLAGPLSLAPLARGEP
jgi:hypothetical protein